MKKIYLFVLAIFVAFTMEAQLFFDDFEDNSLEGYTLFNLDGLTPFDEDLATMADSAWTLRFISSQGWTFGNSAFSVSWYENDEGPSDDWLITPAIEIGTNATLEWDAMAITSSGLFRDRYQVFISSSPDLEALGLLAPVFTMGDTGEVDFPIHRSLDLAGLGFENETIYVAFRNSTQPFVSGNGDGPGNGGNELAIDNIEVNGDPLSSENVEFFQKLRVQPNPVAKEGDINLSFSIETAENVTIEVMDITGKIHNIVTNQNLPAGSSQLTIERADMAPGLYLIRLSAGNRSSIVKTFLN